MIIIENLEEFTGLKVLYIEGNGKIILSKSNYLQYNMLALSKIEGLENLTNLRSLYL